MICVSFREIDATLLKVSRKGRHPIRIMIDGGYATAGTKVTLTTSKSWTTNNRNTLLDRLSSYPDSGGSGACADLPPSASPLNSESMPRVGT